MSQCARIPPSCLAAVEPLGPPHSRTCMACPALSAAPAIAATRSLPPQVHFEHLERAPALRPAAGAAAPPPGAPQPGAPQPLSPGPAK